MDSGILTRGDHVTVDIEQAITMANREVLGATLGNVDEKQLIAFSIEVATRRAAYLKKAMNLSDHSADRVDGEELQTLRLDYEEAKTAFTELVRAIDRGYLDIHS